ncbi:DUF2345 domain-containing protein, partial [Azoarcus indigens]
PVIALSAPAGIALGSGRSIALGADEFLDAAARQQLQLSAGERMVLNAGNGLGTFAQAGDMRHIAHQGELLLQAQHNSLRVEADQSVEISASQQHVLLAADRHVTLLCGGAYLKLADGNLELGMPGEFIVKAGKHNFLAPQGDTTDLPSWVVSSFQMPRALNIRYAYSDLKPVVDAPYCIVFEDGSTKRGVLDGAGCAWIENPPAPSRIYFGFDQREAFAYNEPQVNPLHGVQITTPAEAHAALERYRKLESEYLADLYFPDEIKAIANVDYDDLVEDYQYEGEWSAAQDDQAGEPDGSHEEIPIRDDAPEHAQ